MKANQGAPAENKGSTTPASDMQMKQLKKFFDNKGG